MNPLYSKKNGVFVCTVLQSFINWLLFSDLVAVVERWQQRTNFVSLQIANVLLHNKGKWDTERRMKHRPILVVCYTNHALDQFLEGIHQFHPKGIVRVGGRSQSDIMKACSLSQLKHEMHEVRENW